VADPFAGAADVQDRLDFALSELEQTAVDRVLEDLSDEARWIAGREWADVSNVPNQVRNTVIKAAARWARNMNGYVLSRAGDETVQWSDVGDAAGSAEFTDKEIKLLKAIGDGRTGSTFFGSVETYAYIAPRKYADEYVAVEHGLKPFPFNQPGGGW